ncbi:GspE/PulE family protein [Algisphaera agarilytica]|uniref:Type IV pilus assembly protein PilB n=1 Tax=Algisphaera agarilytica TaxID=1385975 RepID=A0A7X0LMB7_9BACT|nr:ATPase, T2SS/T4P/T4SS family [Algisphaera agarilytica]MBB6431476.1 type IV pilus assembly protein PilB [Algisphaera agarilytica]
MARKRLQLGQILKQWRLVDDQQLEEALKISKGSRKRIGESLVALGYITENDVAKALASQFGLEFVDLDQPNVIDRDNLELIPQDMVKKYLVLPLGKDGNTLKVLVHDPMDINLIDDLQFRLGGKVELALSAKGKISEYIDSVMSDVKDSIDKLTMDMSVDTSMDMSLDSSMDQSIDIEDNSDDPNQGPIIKLVNQIIAEAVNGRASDIHIEPFADRVRLRYRIDGVCHERDVIPKRTQGSVVARLKIMAGVRVEEKRIPQDGRIKMRVDGKIVDFRFSSCPTYHGESIVMRILRPDAAMLGLEKLGMRADTLEGFQKVIHRPNGIFLVTGPTGSGKTTTLYSALNELNRPDRKIITAEDPIEYNFKGINQCQVNMNMDPPLDFKLILRAMLRQAPNIILVGEIRDMEVGEVAVQAALTGHMVFSTLHTNDAPSAITRLIDMGLKPFLVASSIQAVLGQRLVRILCDHCKVPDSEPDRKMMALCGMTDSDLEGQTIYKPQGCARCGNTGYRGRRGVYELMFMNAELRELAFNRAQVSKLRAAAVASGMRTLLGDGKLKVLDGQTTLEEIARIAQVEGTVELEDDDLAA